MTTKIPAELSSTPGIVDNSNATAITIDSSEKVILGDTESHSGVDDLIQIESPASGGGYGIQIRRNDTNTDQQVGRIMLGNNSDVDLAAVIGKTDGAANSGAVTIGTSNAGTFAEKFRVTNEGVIRARNANGVGHYASAAGLQWISLADDASIGLTDTTAGSMLVCAYEGGTGSGALYFANYYGGTSILASNGSNLFSNSDTDGRICVFKSSLSHTVTFKNRTGVTINVFAVSVFAAHI